MKLQANIINQLIPGFFLVSTVTFFAFFISSRFNFPIMLLALLIGMIFNFIGKKKLFKAGVDFSANQVLRFGVALLGFRLSIQHVFDLGYFPVSFTIILVFFTFFAGIGISYLFKNKLAIGCLIGGSVAVCGASAALAVSTVIPKKKVEEKDILFVILGVTILSTVAMVIYPLISKIFEMPDIVSGFLMGSTIHDVAQVVGAGYSISNEAGIVATFVKMIRVATLPFIVILTSYMFSKSEKGKLKLPWFLMVFIIAAFVTNIFQFSAKTSYFLQQSPTFFLVLAISALGIKTNITELFKVKLSYIIIIIVTTIGMLGFSLLGISIIF